MFVINVEPMDTFLSCWLNMSPEGWCQSHPPWQCTERSRMAYHRAPSMLRPSCESSTMLFIPLWERRAQGKFLSGLYCWVVWFYFSILLNEMLAFNLTSELSIIKKEAKIELWSGRKVRREGGWCDGRLVRGKKLPTKLFVRSLRDISPFFVWG